MRDVWFVTNFGDQAVLLPLTVGVALVFASSGWLRGAVAWTTAIGATLAVTLALKLSSLACAHLALGTFLNSPSGHTAGAAAVYGGLFVILARLFTKAGHWTLPCATSIALVIGTSRLTLDLHTGPEVVTGGAVGVCGALATAKLAGAPPPGLRVRRLVAMALLVVVVFHGLHMPAEAAIRTFAFYVWQLSECR